jgi:integral membrane protein
MAHGWLFVAYVALVAYIRAADDWSFRKTALALVASVVPFGTFWADVKLFRK